MLRSTSARLAALYTAGFAIGVLLLGVTTFLTTRSALVGQFEQRILTEAAALTPSRPPFAGCRWNLRRGRLGCGHVRCDRCPL